MLFGLGGIGSSLLHPLGSVASTLGFSTRPGVVVYSTGGSLGLDRWYAIGTPLWFPKTSSFRSAYFTLALMVRDDLRREFPLQRCHRITNTTLRSLALLLLNIISGLRAWAQCLYCLLFLPLVHSGYEKTGRYYYFSLAAPWALSPAAFADRLGRRMVNYRFLGARSVA